MANISKSRAIVGDALKETGVKFSNIEKFYTQDDMLTQTGRELLANEKMYNTFCDLLVNKIGTTLFTQRQFKNPFAEFKTIGNPLGLATEDIFVNKIDPIKFESGSNTSITGEDAINRVFGIPDQFKYFENDVKVVYYPLNTQVVFPISIKYAEMQQGLTSWANMDTFTTTLLDNLARSAEIWEFNQVKELLGKNFELDVPASTKRLVDDKTQIDWASEYAITCRDLAISYTFNGKNYNNWVAWATNKGLTGKALKPFFTNTTFEDLYLITRADIGANIDVSVVSTAFNKEKTQFMGNTRYTDNWGYYTDEATGELITETYPVSPEIGVKYHTTGELGNYDYFDGEKRHHVELYGYIFDKHFLRVEEKYSSVTDAENKLALFRNYFKHLWEIFNLCPLANATALYTDIVVE